MINPKMFLAKNLYDNLEEIPTRNGYGKGLVKLGEENSNIVVLCADLTESTRCEEFKEKFPKQFVQTGVAEQNMIGVAAGMSFFGKIPFVSTYGVFCPGRNWEQIRVSVCYSQANVKFVGSHTGLNVGADGASHQALEDIAITRCLPGLIVLAPCDFIETKKATIAAGKIKGPVYMRFARAQSPVFTTEKTPFKIGKAEVLRHGLDLTIVACGPLVYQALLAAKELEKLGIKTTVINNHTIKPLDSATLLKAAKDTGAFITVEEHQINGGLGSAICELLSEKYPIPIKRIGVNDLFGKSGSAEKLLKAYGLTAKNIVKEAITIKKHSL